MTREEIGAVTEQDAEACDKLNQMVHEKLGKCWHEWGMSNEGFPTKPIFRCQWCSARCLDPDNPSYNPDYCHSIADAWAIKDWLAMKQFGISRTMYQNLLWEVIGNRDTTWASPLDRVKAFLLMGEQFG